TTPYTVQIALANRNTPINYVDILPSTISITPLTTVKNQSHVLNYLYGKFVALLTFAYIKDSDYDAGKRTVYQKIDEFALTASGQHIDNNSNFKMTDEMFKQVVLYDSSISNKDLLVKDNLYFISYVNDIKEAFGNDQTSFDGFKAFSETQPQLDVEFSTNPSASRILVTAWEFANIVLSNGILYRK